MLVEPIIMSIKVATKDKVKTIGVAFSNTSLREIGVGEFVDNDLFSNTEVRNFLIISLLWLVKRHLSSLS